MPGTWSSTFTVVDALIATGATGVADGGTVDMSG